MQTEGLKLLNLKQPWAWALVHGVKNVENRSQPIGSKHIFPLTVAIVASKSKPSYKDLALLKTLTKHVPARDDFPLGCIVGLVEFTACVKPFNSIWYNPPDFAWVVGRYVAFSAPIPNVKGSQSALVSLDAKTHRADKDRIVQAIANCNEM